ncbi:PapD-like protein [Phycomyces blakesleeanus]|uniref:MSP domain-containing protein n=2 Tax=Phycomyces blakesleeanus TaxID=4837 RepID=A0A162V3K8_PHYB8|nr:hypothetical protein PHYBLDRAFT_179214 [Phycomyces blakesleeanus NRRL 1555(-)]OAD79713.1 hypothetical protein PHYBLDRAFT_179214 [Phycomyces blakesleeanus NRRL 1555(-)]|eukprot:XP_018297753.1 hypothetical protein PHYBLDRAFT_179214 [Phycomyces blakesleeanus NRRL 1555(-)]
MSLKIIPGDQLEFVRPLTRVVSSTLRLYNPGTSDVAFKVKTTAPRQYCVRPNAGLIKPQATMEVQVMFQPLPEEPPIGFKCKDKFLVQSVQVSDHSEDIALPDLWANVEATNKQSIEQKKLRCAFVDEVVQAPPQVEEEKKVGSPAPDAAPVTVEPEVVNNQTQEEMSDARETIKMMQQKLESYEQEMNLLRRRKEESAQEVFAPVQPAVVVVPAKSSYFYSLLTLAVLVNILALYYIMSR